MRVFLTISFLFVLFDTYSSQIPSGINTKDINIWRYWEKTDTGYKYKMIVFNTSDSTIVFTLRQAVYLGDHMKLDTTKNKILAGPASIEKDKYVILDIPSSTERQETMHFILNEKRVGLLSLDNVNPPDDLPSRKYCSNEGLNGRGGIFWISKNELITKDNQTDTIILHFNYFSKPIFGRDGIHLLKFRPYENYKRFEVTAGSKVIGYYDVNNEYVLELPFHTEINDKYKMEVLITYKVTKRKNLFLGLSAASGINILKYDWTIEELRNKMKYSMGFYLPIIVK